MTHPSTIQASPLTCQLHLLAKNAYKAYKIRFIVHTDIYRIIKLLAKPLCINFKKQSYQTPMFWSVPISKYIFLPPTRPSLSGSEKFTPAGHLTSQKRKQQIIDILQ